MTSVVKATPLFLATFLLWSAATMAQLTPPAPSGAVVREAGAIYIEDVLPKPIKLATLADTPIYYKIDLARYLGTLKKGQIVEVQAIADGAYRVRGLAQQGQVVGWVEPQFLNPLKKDFLDNLKQTAARRDEVAALIARNEVAVNMTPEEVVQALGKPTKKSSHLDAKGREEVWEFIKYDRIAKEIVGRDSAGNLVTNIVYEKIPIGKLAVTFSNNLVTTLEQSEGSLERAAQVKIVPAPFSISF